MNIVLVILVLMASGEVVAYKQPQLDMATCAQASNTAQENTMLSLQKKSKSIEGVNHVKGGCLDEARLNFPPEVKVVNGLPEFAKAQ